MGEKNSEGREGTREREQLGSRKARGEGDRQPSQRVTRKGGIDREAREKSCGRIG